VPSLLGGVPHGNPIAAILPPFGCNLKQMAPIDEVWEVVGGAPKGGLVVRRRKDKLSEEVRGRLSTGALVIALEYDASAERMLFEKVSGAGPESGWVCTSFKGKQLMVPAEDGMARKDRVAEARPYSKDVEEVDAVDSKELAMKLYCARFGVAEPGEDGELSGLRRPVLPVQDRPEDGAERPQAAVCAELQQTLKGAAAGAEAEELVLSIMPSPHVARCWHCSLPLGETAYTLEGDEDKDEMLMHSECTAQMLLRDTKKMEEERTSKAAREKKVRREEYAIGWKAEHIPLNAGVAKRLSSPVPEGLCCLVLDESTRTVSLAATVEPQAAVNLDYLSTALEVRRRESREPLFSLDPVENGDARLAMQVKRFEPAWLAGTDVGEVLFQSDYHLKELSMGEYEQPVVGMKSCHDYSDGDTQDKWSAREWFVVRKAEVQMSDDFVIMPHVKMGVEAREQVLGEHGLEDVKTTRPNHPLVRYADAFTHNFDLIAERKSVVYHLRELAKASVIAKFLVEADISLDTAWLAPAGEMNEACCLEIPQLWNERCRSEIRVQDGMIMNADAGFGKSLHRLYGGVQFGLDKFQLSGSRQPARMMSAGLAARQFVQPARHLSSTLSAGLATRQFQRSFGPMGVQPARVSAGVGLDKFALSGARQPSRMMSAGLAARQFVQPARHLSATLSAGLATRQFQRSFGPMSVQPSRVAGVDLNLDEFNLSAPTPVSREGGSALQSDAGVDISAAFWSSINDESASMFSKEDKTLLRSIFNPSLSDRHLEGDRFVPPDTSSTYVQSLRFIIKEEEEVRRQRKKHFCGTSFVMDSPGQLFPSSWRASVEISHQEASRKQSSRPLHPRLDYKAQAQVFEQALKKAVPAFDKRTEDGTRYRIYRFGSLEVRTTEDTDEEEKIGAVFSHCASTDAPKRHELVKDEERLVKATEYVEASGKDYHCYVVMETEMKNTILTEELKNGTLRREANPKDLEDRNSLAKVLRSADCTKFGLTVGGMKALQSNIYNQVTGSRETSFRMKC